MAQPVFNDLRPESGLFIFEIVPTWDNFEDGIDEQYLKHQLEMSSRSWEFKADDEHGRQ